MSQVNIKFPDGSVKDFAVGTTGLEIALSISPRLAKEAIVVRVNGELRDMSYPIPAMPRWRY